MITIDDIKIAPVSPEELREAYETLRRHCRECYYSNGCDYCKMQGLCVVNIAPRCWPEYDSIQYGDKHYLE